MAVKTKIILTADDRTKAAFKSAGRSIAGLERSVQRAQRAFGALLGAGAIGGVTKTIVDAGLAMDRLERTFRASTGSVQAASRELDFTRQLSQDLGLNLQETAAAYAKLTAAAKGTAIEGEQARQIFTAVSEASAVLGLSAEQTGGALTAIEQIISKGKVSAEELRGQLGERLPGAFQIAARAINVTTSELDEMLRRGDLTADQLLPKLATELRKTFGSEVEEAANSAQAAFARFENAIFTLSNSIAESGLLDNLATTAEFLARIAGGASDSTVESLERTAAGIREQIVGLEQVLSNIPDISAQGDYPQQLANLRELLALTETRLRRERDIERARSRTRVTAILDEEGLLEAIKRQDEAQLKADESYRKSLDSFRQKYETAEQQVQRLTAELEKFRETLDPAEFARIQSQINQILVEGIEEFELPLKRQVKDVKKAYDEMSAFSKRAAENMQDAFAEFLFDPFDDGLKGMLQSFVDTIRRMVAEAAAAQFFNGLQGSGESGGIGGFLSSLLPGFATGGEFTVGGSGGTDSQLVAFKATPGERVSVATPSQQRGSGGITFEQHNHFGDGVDEVGVERAIRRNEDALVNRTIEVMRQLHYQGRLTT